MSRFHFSYDLKPTSIFDHDDISTNFVEQLSEFEATYIVKPVASTILFSTNVPYNEVRDSILKTFGEDLYFALSEVAFYKGDTGSRIRTKPNEILKSNFKDDYLD
jgi:hypothetical protein